MNVVPFLAVLLAQEDPDRPAWAAKGGTHVSYFSTHEENDAFALEGTDSDYTQGLRIQLLIEPVGEGLRDRGFPTGPADGLDAPLDPLWMPHHLYGEDPMGESRFAAGIALSQLLYTPKNLLLRTVVRDDRPYAAWAHLGIMTVVTDRPAHAPGGEPPLWQDVWEVDIGIIGPAALGEEIQPAIHRALNTDRPTWVGQLPNELTLMLGFDRRWLVELLELDLDGGKCDAIFVPHVGGRIGSPFTELVVGGRLAGGWNTPRQFNVGSPMAVHSAVTSSYAEGSRTGELGWWSAYLFAGFESRAVLRDTFLDGTLVRDSVRVSRNYLVADLTYGLGFRFAWTTLSFGQVYRSAEVRADSGFHNFGFVEIAIELGF